MYFKFLTWNLSPTDSITDNQLFTNVVNLRFFLLNHIGT